MAHRITRPTMPLSVKTVLGVLGAQIAVSASTGLELVRNVERAAEQGRHVPPAQYLSGYGALVAAVVLVVWGALLIYPVAVAGPLIAGVELLGAADAVVRLLLGEPGAAVDVALSVIVLMQLLRPDTVAWLRRLPVDSATHSRAR